MEMIYPEGHPLSAYFEGEGSLETELRHDASSNEDQGEANIDMPTSFAPPNAMPRQPRILERLQPIQTVQQKMPTQSSWRTLHHAWSTAVNSRIGRADNAKFMEHFRYIIVASQLLNEYLDQGVTSQAPTVDPGSLVGKTEEANLPTSFYGATATALVAFTVVYIINWARSRDGGVSKSRVALVLAGVAVVAIVGYSYIRRQWLKYLRQQAVDAVSTLTTNWQAYEVAGTSTLAFIQEVELVSKGYRLSTPLPPASRIEDSGTARRCGRLRKALYKAYAAVIPACIEACDGLGALIDEDDLEKYFDIYDISPQDAKEASGSDALSPLDDDPESLKSLRVLSYRCNVLRRVIFCSLMATEADGGKPDFQRWRTATDVMVSLGQVTAIHAEKLRVMLGEMETLNVPKTPVKSPQHGPGRERIRTQVRKIGALSSGIRGLQAKMQILREESSRSIEQTDDLTDLGPNLMAQYESIGADLRELMQAWETGKASLASNITKQERRISLASSGLRSPVSSLGGLTAVDEDGTPSDALRALNGGSDSKSNRSSLATTPSNEDEEMVFEAIAIPRQRSTLTREERISKMYEERERQATVRAKRESNTNMMRELESVINCRPRKTGDRNPRITSI
ncbi:hypothetical protein MBLNU230_g4966t1 [Neophaeotheca triangularis]